ncbi:hypothetical protein [Alicyclobacillus sp. SO9]|uniref:hypothetical protein n=1 Tax=Alicyclobacillus sp. SO9 TaxID=2665646 RepID=UPI0018E7EC0D|nr:hypothetical protein [Alicyclobacillus sp. SO9]QQE79134.1 hypothetical protein GI364_01030 [Alicyclobacillus sp. SO9]
MTKQILWGTMAAVLLAVTGCGSHSGTQQTNITNTSVSSSQAPAKIVKLTGSKIEGMKGGILTVTSTINNNTSQAVNIKPGDLRLKIGAKTLISPASTSKIPTQVPANSTKTVKLDFPMNKVSAGKVQPVLMFKPETGQAASELTQLPSVTLKH